MLVARWAWRNPTADGAELRVIRTSLAVAQAQIDVVRRQLAQAACEQADLNGALAELIVTLSDVREHLAATIGRIRHQNGIAADADAESPW